MCLSRVTSLSRCVRVCVRVHARVFDGKAYAPHSPNTSATHPSTPPHPHIQGTLKVDGKLCYWGQKDVRPIPPSA